MKTYISLLRGINVSGHNIIKMDALKKMYAELKFKNPVNYLQSGNIIFQYKDTPFSQLSNIISSQIKKDFHLDVFCIVLDIEKMEKINNNNVFSTDKNKDTSYIYISFISNKPSLESSKLIHDKLMEGEEISITDEAVYFYCPGSYGKSKLSNNFLESKLKVIATTRNWKSANQILSMAKEFK